jgi:hypothetical protein
MPSGQASADGQASAEDGAGPSASRADTRFQTSRGEAIDRYRQKAAASLMGRVGQEIRSFDVLSQAMVIAATGLVTIIPLLLVLSSFSPFGKPGGLSTRIVDQWFAEHGMPFHLRA